MGRSGGSPNTLHVPPIWLGVRTSHRSVLRHLVRSSQNACICQGARRWVVGGRAGWSLAGWSTPCGSTTRTCIAHAHAHAHMSHDCAWACHVRVRLVYHAAGLPAVGADLVVRHAARVVVGGIRQVARQTLFGRKDDRGEGRRHRRAPIVHRQRKVGTRARAIGRHVCGSHKRAHGPHFLTPKRIRSGQPLQ